MRGRAKHSMTMREGEAKSMGMSEAEHAQMMGKKGKAKKPKGFVPFKKGGKPY